MKMSEAQNEANRRWGGERGGLHCYGRISRGRVGAVYRVGFDIRVAWGHGVVLVHMGASEVSWEDAFTASEGIDDPIAIVADVAANGALAACQHTEARPRGYHRRPPRQCPHLGIFELVRDDGSAIAAEGAGKRVTLVYCADHCDEHARSYLPHAGMRTVRRPICVVMP